MLHKSEVWALQKPLPEGCIKCDHLLRKSSLLDHYLYFYGWFINICYKENLNFGLV